ncbi:MAG TPA: ABC transporter ATP-binding protein [Microthrixaceae bacterium]|nr:ABC transporter ATP-binding protein [Microthrixaceae bacterium]
MIDAQPLVEARGVSVSYGPVQALRDCDLRIQRGERVAVMGASGSGKSTLLHCLAGILRPTSGEIFFAGERIDTLPDRRRSQLRLEQMGVVFQFGDLVPELTLDENVMLPLLLTGSKRRTARTRSRLLVEQLGIADVADRRPGEVSGGQAQRAAVARALVHGPAVVFADEPTGSLDTVAEDTVLSALVGLASSEGSTLVVITHDHEVAAHLDRLVYLRDGSVVDNEMVLRS